MHRAYNLFSLPRLCQILLFVACDRQKLYMILKLFPFYGYVSLCTISSVILYGVSRVK